MRSRGSGVAALALTLAACAAAPTPQPSPLVIQLPIYEPGPNAGCAGASPVVTVRLDPGANPPAWFEWDGGRWDVLWPVGYRLLVGDPILVVDGRGAAVLRNGQHGEVGICATDRDDVVVFAGEP